MSQGVKVLASITFWMLFFIGCFSLLLSPVARYVTREDLWLWVAVGISTTALLLALMLSKIIEAEE